MSTLLGFIGAVLGSDLGFPAQARALALGTLILFRPTRDLVGRALAVGCITASGPRLGYKSLSRIERFSGAFDRPGSEPNRVAGLSPSARSPFARNRALGDVVIRTLIVRGFRLARLPVFFNPITVLILIQQRTLNIPSLGIRAVQSRLNLSSFNRTLAPFFPPQNIFSSPPVRTAFSHLSGCQA